jgi:hypothetical protein
MMANQIIFNKGAYMNAHLMHEQALAIQATGHEYVGGVSWGAVLAGAAAAAALSFILLVLGVGLGLSTISPYSYNATPITGATIAWIAFMQLAASAIGGYMAGRLRLKWLRVHGDEVYFRDTAHGLLAWAVATLATVAMLSGGIKAALGGAIDAGTAVATVAAPAIAADGSAANRTGYYADMLLRSATGVATTAPQREEMSKVLAASLVDGRLSTEDRTYLAQIVASRTNMAQADAQRRVDDIYARASKAAADAKAKAMAMADEARKAAAHSALWMFVALLLGAFVASLAATFGGRCRDHIRVHLPSSD